MSPAFGAVIHQFLQLVYKTVIFIHLLVTLLSASHSCTALQGITALIFLHWLMHSLAVHLSTHVIKNKYIEIKYNSTMHCRTIVQIVVYQRFLLSVMSRLITARAQRFPQQHFIDMSVYPPAQAQYRTQEQTEHIHHVRILETCLICSCLNFLCLLSTSPSVLLSFISPLSVIITDEPCV